MHAEPTGHSLERTNERRLLVQLWGEPTRDHVEELAAEVERSLRVPPRVEQLLLELSEVRHIDVSTCRSLAAE